MSRFARSITALVLAVPAMILAQASAPASRPAAWSDIDQRMVFLTVQLASVETSIEAVEKQLKSAGYKITVRQDDAARYQKGNELMDRNAGGPRRWQDFYGDTAEKFFYNPPPAPGELRLTATVLKTNSANPKTPAPAHQRPPQFDYIYRANDNAKNQAEADVAKLAGKVDQLLARRRQLESEQNGLWTKIAFRAVAGRELLGKPLYRFDLKATETDAAAAQRLEALRAAMDFLRTNNKLIELAEKQVDANQAGFISTFEDTIARSRADYEFRVMKQPALVMDSGDRATTLGKLTAVAKRMHDVARNIADAHKLSLDGDKAGDEQRKQTFRMQLQESLITYGEAVLAGDECVTQLARDWKIVPDLEKAAPEAKVEVPEPAQPIAAPVAPPQDPAQPQQPFNVLGEWRKVDSGTRFHFTADGMVDAPKAQSSWLRRGQWQVKDSRLVLTYDQEKIELAIMDTNTIVGRDKRGVWHLQRLVDRPKGDEGTGEAPAAGLPPRFEGFYRIINKKTGGSLFIANANQGNSVELGRVGNSAAQQWQILTTTDDRVRLVNRLAGHCLGVREESMKPGVDAINWMPADVALKPKPEGHDWLIEDAGDGYVRLVNARSGHCLSAVHKRGVQIERGKGDEQLWKLDSLPAPGKPPTVGTRTEAAPVKLASGSINVSGDGFQVGTLANGEKAFLNRKYVWQEVPAEFSGWQFTRVGGDETAKIRVEVQRSTVMHIAVGEQSGFEGTGGWERRIRSSFSYNDKHNSRLIILSKDLQAGDTFDLPRAPTFVGTIVLLPPTGAVAAAAKPQTAAEWQQQLNDLKNWTVKKGDWSQLADGHIRGEGDSRLEFAHELPENFTLRFRMSVVKGLRPRVWLIGSNCYLGNEGYQQEIALHPKSARSDGHPVPYRHGEVLTATMSVSGERFILKIGESVQTGRLDRKGQLRVRLSGGDGWSKGTTDYWGFELSPANTPAAVEDVPPVSPPMAMPPSTRPGSTIFD